MLYDVSVIITTKNRINDLKRAVRSVLNQTFSNYELIIVNDASEDETESFLLSLQSDRIKIINLKKSESKGGNYARNIGMKQARGRYISLLDDDDVWHLRKIEKQFELIENRKDVGFVYCGINRIIDNTYIIKKIPHLKGDLSNQIFSQIICLTSTIFFKKELLNDVGYFDENVSHWQEYEFTMRLFQHTRVDFVPELLVDIHVNTKTKNRLSNQYQKWEESVKYIKEKHINIISENGLNQQFENVIIEDSANRKFSVGNKGEHRKNMFLLWKRKKNIKYLIRGVLNLSSNNIQKLKGRKMKKSD